MSMINGYDTFGGVLCLIFLSNSKTHENETENVGESNSFIVSEANCISNRSQNNENNTFLVCFSYLPNESRWKYRKYTYTQVMVILSASV